MNSLIYYYTGTGNSLWASRFIADALKGTRIEHMKSYSQVPGKAIKAIGFVFPVHMWGIPRPVVEFLTKFTRDLKAELKTGTEKKSDRYYFACALNAGEVAESLVQLDRILSGIGAKLSLGVSLAMPSNYIPWGGPGPEESLQVIYKKAREKLDRFCENIKIQESSPPEKGSLKEKLLYSGIIYTLAFPQIHGMDKNFTVDSSCTSCGICERICPASNISLEEGKPVWHSHCEQCMACIQWCPTQSIQYGEKTRAYPRYHHPEIRVSNMYMR